jgi:hypothetical protein
MQKDRALGMGDEFGSLWEDCMSFALHHARQVAIVPPACLEQNVQVAIL